MADTVLVIIQNVCRRVGIPVPSIVVSSANKQVNQLQGLLDEVGQDLVTRFKFQELTRRATFPSIASENQGPLINLLGVEPEMLENCTLWDDTAQRPIPGPLTNAEHQMYKATTSTGSINEYRIMGGELLIFPVMPAGHSISVLYRVKTWLLNSTTNLLKQEISADDDVPVLDDKLITLGLIARWKEEKGLPYAEAAKRYESMAVGKAAKSGTHRTLYLDEPEAEVIPGIFVPAGSWNV